MWKKCCERLGNAFRPYPVSPWETLIMRILFAIVIWMTLPDAIHNWEQKRPVGLAMIPGVDLTFLNSETPHIDIPQGLKEFLHKDPRGLAGVICLAMLPLLIIYASGWGLTVVLPIITLIHILIRTLYNSQGFDHHGFQLVSLVLLAQTIVVLYFGIRKLVKKKPYQNDRGLSMHSYFLYYSIGTIACTYVVSAKTKWENSDGKWLSNSHYIATQLVKTDRGNYYTRLDDKFGGDVPWAETMRKHPHITRICLAGGFFLELLAFLALLNRFMALVIGISIIAFHEGVIAVMNLHFIYNEYAAFIFMMNVPFWIWWGCRKLGSASKKATPAARSSA